MRRAMYIVNQLGYNLVNFRENVISANTSTQNPHQMNGMKVRAWKTYRTPCTDHSPRKPIPVNLTLASTGTEEEGKVSQGRYYRSAETSRQIEEKIFPYDFFLRKDAAISSRPNKVNKSEHEKDPIEKTIEDNVNLTSTTSMYAQTLPCLGTSG
jgi:hypothetical protein